MNVLRLLCWILFLGSLLFLRARSWHANHLGKAYNIVKLELAGTESGKVLLQRWNNTKVGRGTLIDYARVDTWVDFLFIISYTGVLLLISHALRKREKQGWLLWLLQACTALALLAGLLDIIENIILLADMHRYSAGKMFYSSRWVSYPKFGLLLLVLLTWGLSLLGRLGKGKAGQE
jgi:hypothetical protein